jgi:hypothetical protein
MVTGSRTAIFSLARESEMSEESAQEEYDREFEAKDGDSGKLKAAFLQVADIRKFEIELYWKRAGYFWALIAIALAGYFAILSSDHILNKFLLSSIVGAIGFVFTFAWYLVNRGSKYWQENWENHLDLLEDRITGPLYKTLLERPGLHFLSEKLVTGPIGISSRRYRDGSDYFCVHHNCRARSARVRPEATSRLVPSTIPSLFERNGDRTDFKLCLSTPSIDGPGA